MISKPLMKQSIKANWVLWLATTIIVCVIIAILKIVLATSGANSFHISMDALSPYIVALLKQGLTIQDLLGTMGLNENLLQNMQGMDMNKMMNNMFYNLAGVIVPMIYSVIVANNLVASQVDRGSMAFVLSTPTKRSSVVVTQSTYLIVSLAGMFILTFLVDIIASVAIGLEVNYLQVFELNFGLFLLMFAMSGICFFFASYFNLAKYSYAASGGLLILFYINRIIGMFGDPSFVQAGMGVAELKVFDYMTIITLLNTNSIFDGTLSFIWQFAILFVIGLVTYIAGGEIFKRKDLPL